MGSSSSNSHKYRYRKRPPNVAVREHGEGQKVSTSVVSRKARSDKLPEESGCPLPTDSIKWPPTGLPSEAFPLGRGKANKVNVKNEKINLNTFRLSLTRTPWVMMFIMPQRNNS